MSGTIAGRRTRRTSLLGVLLVTPAAATIAVVMIVPLIFAGYASLYDYRLGHGKRPFVFVDNYVQFFRDPVAIKSLVNTVVYTAVDLTLCLVLGIGVAVLLSTLTPRVGNVLRAVFTMPLLISPIIVALIWRYMYDPQYGFVYWVLGFFGLDDWFGGLSKSSSALLSIAIADVWNVTPFIMLVFSAALTTVPEELHEAARIDGAGPWRIFFRITLPLLTKILAVLVLIRGTDAFRVFDLVYGMTNGGPANSTSSLSFYAYKAAYQNNQMGYGMAISIITLVALVAIFSPLMRNSAGARQARA
jgi:ABC-type sugar transport system permease subunit